MIGDTICGRLSHAVTALSPLFRPFGSSGACRPLPFDPVSAPALIHRRRRVAVRPDPDFRVRTRAQPRTLFGFHPDRNARHHALAGRFRADPHPVRAAARSLSGRTQRPCDRRAVDGRADHIRSRRSCRDTRLHSIHGGPRWSADRGSDRVRAVLSFHVAQSGLVRRALCQRRDRSVRFFRDPTKQSGGSAISH